MADIIHSVQGLTTIKKKNVDSIIDAVGNFHLLRLLRMRQMCILPSLLEKTLTGGVGDGDGDGGGRIGDGDIELEDIDADIIDKGIRGVSKLQAVCDTIIQRHRSNASRAKLVFCHFRNEINWINQNLTKRGLNVAFIDGRVNKTQRNKLLQSTELDVLILQIKTACEGLNLQQFKEVYFVSPHWNPFVEDQAIARCHRLGQTEKVDVFRFIMNKFNGGISMDQYCRMVQREKREVFDEVVELTTDNMQRADRFIYKIRDELLAVTWHPSRVMNWCLTEDERTRMKEVWG